MSDDRDHYLKRELYRLVQTDPQIFDFLQDGSLDGLWYWDVENPREEWLSPRFKELFGYADDDVPNTSDWWQENIHPDDLQVALDNFEKHKTDPNHPYDQVVRYRHKDGSTVWVRCRGIAIRNEKGEAIRMLGAHTDLTDLKRTEKALQRARNELESRVEERTKQLENVHESLKSEMVEHMRLERALRESNRRISMILESIALPDSALERLESLTKREREMLSHLVGGKSTKAAAQKLGISPRTAEKHRQSILRKMEVVSLVELVPYAMAVKLMNMPVQPSR